MIPPSPSPSPSPSLISDFAAVQQTSSPPLPVDFSPPLIAMVVVVAAAFLVVTYSRLISRHVAPPLLRLIRRRRIRHQSSSSDLDSLSLPYYESPSAFSDGFHVISPYGLDDSVIKTIPLSVYTKTRRLSSGGWINDCAVCLIEFDEDDYVRTLPACSHAFHVDCIDIWLRSHANCPLCRAGILRPPNSPFVPLMAARIRPSLDEALLRTIAAAEIEEIEAEADEIIIPPPRRRDHDFLLKRSYSFGFERRSERMMMMEANSAMMMTTPWRRGGFWNKRPSPFGSLGKPRVFSFRYYRGMKSPAFFRRGRGFFPLSESSSRFSGGGGSSRRTRSMTSPMFMRRSSAAAFSSSRLRCGDPEALLSPERFNRPGTRGDA